MSPQRSVFRWMPVWALTVGLWLLPLLSVTADPSGKSQPKTPRPKTEFYMFMGRNAIWSGSSIRYTVYRPARVEARFVSMSGEIVLVLDQGEQQPGQYTLPFDGTKEGTLLAGFYFFELYFGDEYVAKYRMAARPLPRQIQ